MTDKQILKGIKKYFDVRELVSYKVYNKFGENSWRFLDIRLLHAILIIREVINKPIIVNNWHIGGNFSQRGLRSNLSQICRRYFNKGILYLSAHVLGKGVDFDVQGVSADDVRDWIVFNQDLFPFKIRLENKMKGKSISWVHLDVIQDETKPKVYLFDV